MNSLDTNILIYAFDPSEPAKHFVATQTLFRACTEGWATKHQMQLWDALIIATCTEHGVTLENPFKKGGASAKVRLT
jgi:predicted nucleic acid-binding protein